MSIPYHTKFDRYVSFDRAEFLFVPNSTASKKAAFDKMMEYTRKAVAAIQDHAGRPLSTQEILRGVDHPENRTKSEIVAQSQPDPQPRGVDVGNPYQYAIDKGWDKPRGKETKSEAYARKAKEYEAKQQIGADKAAFDADPKRHRAIAHAKHELDALRYDPSATVEEIEMAETRLHVARNESLDEYKEMDRRWRQEKKSKLDEQTRAIDEQISTLRSRKVDIQNRAFDPPSPPAPPAPQAEPTEFHYPVVRASDPAHPQYELVKVMETSAER